MFTQRFRRFLFALVLGALSYSFSALAMDPPSTISFEEHGKLHLSVSSKIFHENSKDAKYEKAFEDLFYGAIKTQRHFVYIAKFGRIEAGKFFDILVAQLDKARKKDTNNHPLSVHLLGFESRVAQEFMRKHELLKLTDKSYLARYIVINADGICDIKKHIARFYEGDNSCLESTVFIPMEGTLTSQIRKTLDSLSSLKFSAPSLVDADSTLKQIGKFLANDESQMRFYPRVELFYRGIAIATTDTRKIKEKYKNFLADITLNGILDHPFKFYTCNGLYVIPFSEIKRFLKGLNYPETTNSMPTFAHLILASNELSPVEKCNAFEQTKNVEGKDNLIDPSKKFLLKIFLDPIHGQLFKDPVITPSGYTFERAFIESWVTTRKTDPMTGDSFCEYVPNDALEKRLPILTNNCPLESFGNDITLLMARIFIDGKTINNSVKKYIEACYRELKAQGDIAIFIEKGFKINSIKMGE